ncbi:centriolar and ciliogenesis-associated protein HYLS1-like [Diadema antillarum]|uniref:centriolar and ciliogenesis-associated protein HYLS1-like n=1 Tax=Diadema antillarum TaxID=105358 RepID=UPI003A8480A2
MADLVFTEGDIKHQLQLLGYRDVPAHHIAQFSRDLEKLIDQDKLPPPPVDYSDVDLTDANDTTGEEISQDSDAQPQTYRQTTSSAARTKPAQSSLDQENRTAPFPGHMRGVKPAAHSERRAVSPQVIDPNVYNSYQRREAKPAEKRIMLKRKVVRKRDGVSHVFDESVTESESDISYLNEGLQRLPLRDDEVDSETSSVGLDSFRRHIGRSNTSQGLYSHRPAGDEESVYKPHLPRSFIRPSSASQTWKHNKKTDPVTRHQMYRAQWSSQKAPGEKKHKELRWNVREHMMHKDEVVQPRLTPRVYVPNTYVVPSDKKRQALRWAVRTQLAHKQMPSSNSFSF